MRNTLLLSLLVLLFACEEDNTEPMLTPTSITVECNRDKDDAFLVSEDIIFSIRMTTDPSVGIASFTIRKAGDELFSRSDYTTNIVEFNFTYTTTRDDLEAGMATFDFELVDQNNTTRNEQSVVQVAVDLPITVAELMPDPGWDLVNDIVVSEDTPEQADILEFEVIVDQFTTNIFWTSLNGSQFYNIPEGTLDFFDINLPYSNLENAISGLMPQDTILITSGGSSAIPIIADIRNNQELILIDRSNLQGSMVGYRKRE